MVRQMRILCGTITEWSGSGEYDLRSRLVGTEFEPLTMGAILFR